jgi:3-deoxy-D-manno-octulosonate 8-phosphate phosphatase (KDO 8-P phosphatase)
MTETAVPYRARRILLDDLMHRLAAVTLVAFDVDGTLTDGRIGIIGTGDRVLYFNTHDGHGIAALIAAGVDVAFVTVNRSNAVEDRADRLKVLYRILGRDDKKAALEELGIPWDRIAYVGDDLNDIGPMLSAGVSFAVANARPEAIAAANHVLSLPGGQGAAREVCDMILRAKGYEVFLGPAGAEWRK